MSHLATTHRPQQGRPGNTTTLSLKHGGEAVKGRLRRPLRGFALDCPAAALGYRLVMWCRPSSALPLPTFASGLQPAALNLSGRDGVFRRTLVSARVESLLMR